MKRSLVTTDILEEKLYMEIGGIYSGCLAEINSYNKSKRTAKVKPLAKIQTPKGWKDLPVVTLPVNTMCAGGLEVIPSYSKGDIVYLAPAMYPTSNQIKGQLETDTTRRHKLENMVVAFGVKKQPSSLTVDKDGFVITDNALMYAQFSASLIEFKIGNSSTQKALLGEDTRDLIEDILDAILAIKVMTPTGPSSPVSGMPDNVTKIEVIRGKLDSLLSGKFKHN